MEKIKINPPSDLDYYSREAYNTLRTNMILGCAITESTGIYSLVVALVLLFIF